MWHLEPSVSHESKPTLRQRPLLAQTMTHTLGAVQEELALRLGLYAQVAERPTPRLGLGIGSGLVLGLGVR